MPGIKPAFITRKLGLLVHAPLDAWLSLIVVIILYDTPHNAVSYIK